MKREYYLLPEDRLYAEARISELEHMIQGLGPDFNDAFAQSSETWHDNSPFEAVRDKQAMYAAELHKLRTLIRESTLTPPKTKRGAAGVGSVVTLDNGSKYRIAGDWTHKAGSHDDGVIWMSREAPLAAAMLAKRVGEPVMLGRKEYRIEQID